MWALRGLRCSLGMKISSNTFANHEEAFWRAASPCCRSQKHFHTSRVIIMVTNDAEPNLFLIAFRIFLYFWKKRKFLFIVKRMKVWQPFFCIPLSPLLGKHFGSMWKGGCIIHFTMKPYFYICLRVAPCIVEGSVFTFLKSLNVCLLLLSLALPVGLNAPQK